MAKNATSASQQSWIQSKHQNIIGCQENPKLNSPRNIEVLLAHLETYEKSQKLVNIHETTLA